MTDELTRDEPPTQAELDAKARCPECGAKGRYHGPREWYCHICGKNYKRTVIVLKDDRLVIL